MAGTVLDSEDGSKATGCLALSEALGRLQREGNFTAVDVEHASDGRSRELVVSIIVTAAAAQERHSHSNRSGYESDAARTVDLEGPGETQRRGGRRDYAVVRSPGQFGRLAGDPQHRLQSGRRCECEI